MHTPEFQFCKPSPSHWPICRMLLPQTISDASARDYLLAIDIGQRELAGAISYCDSGKHFSALQLQVVPPFELTFAGFRMLSAVLAEAKKRGRSSVEAQANETAQPALFQVLLDTGFSVKSQIWFAEGNLEQAFAYLNRMQDVFRQRRIQSVEVVPLSQRYLNDAGRLYAEQISHLPAEASAYTYFTGDLSRFHFSQVLLVNGKVQGVMLIAEAQRTATVYARIVQGQHRGTWASALLFLKSIERLQQAGIERLRFQFYESTHDTAKLVQRLQMQITDRVSLLSFQL